MSDSEKVRVLVHLPHGAAAEVVDRLRVGARVVTVERTAELLERLASEAWRAVVVSLEDEDDMRLLPRVVEAVPSAVVVAVHPQPGFDDVLAAEAAGAAVLLRFPEEAARIPDVLAPYMEESGDHPVSGETPPDDGMVGSSAALLEAYRTLVRVAPAVTPVLVEGESGTGKELVARALHTRSPRAGAPFVPVNCAALPEGLLEAELFGYEKGAFTGAVGRSEGRFGRAHGGTLFLDEIGEMGLGVQAKLLRALESGEIERLGSGDVVRVDARIVVATNRSLEERVAEGAFREDLLYRLAVVRVSLPPLRRRPEDLLPLAEAFVARFAEQHGRPIAALSREAVAMLRGRTWPGNVRELRNVLDRAVLLARGGVVRSVDLAHEGTTPSLAPSGGPLSEGYPATWSLQEVEARHIRRVLARTGGHMGEAASILGVHRNTMTTKVREYGIDPQAPMARESGDTGS
jgi:DNA-binding NtrC family response regulator